MSREGYEGWDSPPRSRGDSSPRSHRRRGPGRVEDRQADGQDAGYGYGPDAYADQPGYGPRPYADPNGYGADGYGGDYQDGYGQDQYPGNGYPGQPYDGGYTGGYADDGYGTGYGGNGYGAGNGRDAYAARDPYAAGETYAGGDYGADPYAGADTYAGADPRASSPHLTDPRASSGPYGRVADPYDTGGGGYAGPAEYADPAAFQGPDGYGGQDGFAGQDPYASPAGTGYDRSGYEQQDSDLYRWRDPQGAGDDPGLARRRTAREDDFDAEDPRHDGFFRGFGGGDEDLGGPGRGRSQGGSGRGRSQSRGRPPGERKSRAGLVALTVVLAIFAGIGYTGFHYYSEYKARHATYSGSGFGSAIILVQPGDTLDSISSQLLSKHVIAAIDPWASFVANKSGLQPGKYRIHIHMSPAAAFAALTSSKNLINSKVTIPDGMRLADILPTLAKESGLPLSQFQTAIKETKELGLPAYANGNPEGYLYPDTYDIAPGETALKILQTAVAQFNTEVAPLHLSTAAATVGYTPAQIITGASLLEAEVDSRYFGQVARVIDNRINQGMALQFDSTIAYALNKHTDQLTAADKAFNSPYNTFTHKDLPPGPIDSPDIAAIQAFLHPPHGDWLYFVTVDKKGTTDFTADPSQQAAWAALAKKNGVT